MPDIGETRRVAARGYEELTEQLDAEVKAYAQLAAQSPSRGAATEALRRQEVLVDRIYWDLAERIGVEALEGLQPGQRLGLDTVQRQFLDFGLTATGHLIFEARLARELDRLLAEVPQGDGRHFPLRYLSDALSEALDKALDIQGCLEVDAQLRGSARKLEILERTAVALCLSRNRLRDWCFVGAQGERLADIDRELEQVGETYARHEDQNRAGGLATGEARREYIAARERLATLLREQRRLRRGVSGVDVLLEVEQKLRRNVADRIVERRRVEQLQVRQVSDLARLQSAARPELRVALSEEIRHLRLLAKLSAQEGGEAPLSALLENVEPVEPAALDQAVEVCLDMDPGLLSGPWREQQQPPCVLFLPARGEGVYDPSRNRLIVPTQGRATLAGRLGAAMAYFRMDMDRLYDESRLLELFRTDIKEHKALTGRRELQLRFLAAYRRWVTDEAAGQRTLEAPVRDWFERHLAPPLDEPILPPRVRGMQPGQLFQAIRELGQALEGLEPQAIEVLLETQGWRREDVARRCYELACVRYRLDDLRGAREWFLKTLDVHPRYGPAYYSLGVLVPRFGESGRGYLESFLRDQPRGYRAQRAMILLAKEAPSQ